MTRKRIDPYPGKVHVDELPLAVREKVLAIVEPGEESTINKREQSSHPVEITLPGDPAAMEDQVLAQFCADAFVKFASAVPFVLELQRRFNMKGRQWLQEVGFLGCSTWDQFCETHFHRTRRAVNKAIAAFREQERKALPATEEQPEAESVTVEQPVQQENAPESSEPEPTNDVPETAETTDEDWLSWLKEHGEEHPEHRLKSIRITELADSGNVRAREWMDLINIVGEIAESITIAAAYEELVCGQPLSAALAQLIADEIRNREPKPTPPEPPTLVDLAARKGMK